MLPRGRLVGGALPEANVIVVSVDADLATVVGRATGVDAGLLMVELVTGDCVVRCSDTMPPELLTGATIGPLLLCPK